MSYPVLPIENAQQLATRLQPEIDALGSGGNPFELEIDESGWVIERPGEDYPRSLVESCATDLKQTTIAHLLSDGLLSSPASIALEASMAGPLHGTLRQCKMDMLEDEDFWRYLALFPLRWFLIAREPELKPQDFGGYSIVQGEDGRERKQRKSLITQLVYRTFLWGKIAFDDNQRNKYSRATALMDVQGPIIDIWHSHLIRTQLGQLGHLPHSFLDILISEIPDGSKMKDPARETEKLLARVKHNVLFDLYEKPQADLIVKEQLSRIVKD